jgi:uncharacterized protein YegP (UPF0339 family)
MEPTRPYPSFLIYKDADGDYRWSYEASKTRAIANSGEGYRNKADCDRAIELVMESAKSAIWVTLEAIN